MRMGSDWAGGLKVRRQKRAVARFFKKNNITFMVLLGFVITGLLTLDLFAAEHEADG